MVGAAEDDADPREGAPDRLIRTPKAGPLGQVVDQARQRPQRERQP
jgi:hypothetical protein